MSFLWRFSSLWRRLIRKRQVEQELSEEVRFYLESLIERKIQRGMDPIKARRLSTIELGGADQIKERVREVSMGHRLETILQDVKYGARMMVKNPLFSVIAVMTLALGIGANTAIFSVVNALLIRPLPYKDPGRLVFISEVTPKRKENFVPGPHFLDWLEESKTLEQIAAYHGNELTLTGGGESEKLNGNRVSSEFFSMLGTVPALGRNFLQSEDVPNAQRVAIISHSLWESRFGSDHNIVGKSIVLDDEGYTVVGVLPADFRFSEPFDVYVPLALDSIQEHGNQQISVLNVIARLSPGVTIDQARTELDAIRGRHEVTKLSGTPFFDGPTRIDSLRDKLVGNTRGLLFILLGAVSLTLLIACANVANLLLSRGAARQKEFSIRTALGAGRFRLIRQMLTESVLLGISGGVVGLAIAFFLTKGLSIIAAADTFGDISRVTTIDIDTKVLGFTLLASIVTGVLFGLAPALRLSRPDVNDA